MIRQVDAVVVGGGVNGLVAAIVLAEAGWDVELVEAAELGGAVRSVERLPGTVSDLFSAFYPLAAVSPVLRALALEDHGLRWTSASTVVAHPEPRDPGRAALLHRDAHETAAALDADHAGDGARWLELVADWQRMRAPLIDALFTPLPAVAPVTRLLRVLGASGALHTARFLALPVHRMGEELFGGRHGRMLLAGNAMHADVPPSAAGSGLFGWLLSMLAQDVGYPVPVGGSGRLPAALGARAAAAGVRLTTGVAVERVQVHGGSAIGVWLADGDRIRARRSVLAAVDVRILLGAMMDLADVPPSTLMDLSHLQPDLPTVKANWTLRRPLPWLAQGARPAGTLHIGVDDESVLRWSTDLETGVLPQRPYMLAGQMTTTDPSRSAQGHETFWAYSHLPRSSTVDNLGPRRLQAQVDQLAERMVAEIERHAPGGLDDPLDHFVQGPADLERDDPNLLDGTFSGGSQQLHQQLVFRPVPGLGGARLPVRDLYLASSSAHPGGAVHGGCGWNAARTALADHGLTGPLRRRLATRLQQRLS